MGKQRRKKNKRKQPTSKKSTPASTSSKAKALQSSIENNDVHIQNDVLSEDAETYLDELESSTINGIVIEYLKKSINAGKLSEKELAAISQTIELNDESSIYIHDKQVVLLIHGIRTRAEWQDSLCSFLEKEENVSVEPIYYGYFDVFRFLSPFFTRHAPISRIEREIRRAIDRYPNHQLTIIAHSFGTYAVGEVLKKHPEIKLHKLILCGSIIHQNYPWDRVEKYQIHGSVINECGVKDIWPILAGSMSWGYHSTGTFGFGTIGIKDRFHDGGHSDFLNLSFAEKYWIPFLFEGDFIKTKRPNTSFWYTSFLNFLSIPWKYIFISVSLYVFYFLLIQSHLR